MIDLEYGPGQVIDGLIRYLRSELNDPLIDYATFLTQMTEGYDLRKEVENTRLFRSKENMLIILRKGEKK